MSSKDVSALILDKFFNSRDEKIIYLSLSPKFQEGLEMVLKDQFNVTRFYDMKKGNLAFEPYSPFLSLLRDSNLSGETVRDSVLKIQENDFVTWFQGRPLEFREDVPVIDEIFFERDSCIQSILKMLRHTEDSVVIFNAQEMAEEGFEVLGGLEKNGSEGKFIFCFDSSTLASLCFDNPVLDSILSKENFYELTLIEQGETNSVNPVTEIQSAENKLKSMDFFDLSQILMASVIFYSFGVFKRLNDVISANIEHLHYDDASFARLFFLLGLGSFYSGTVDDSLYYFDLALENLSEDDDQLFYPLYFYVARVYIFKNSCSIAAKFVKVLLEKAPKKGHFFALGKMLDYLIEEKSEKQINSFKYEETLLFLLRSRLLTNYYSVVFRVTTPFAQNILGIDKMKLFADKAVKWYTEAENKYGLSIAYHWLGIIYSIKEEKKIAIEWYRKSHDLRLELGDLKSLIQIKNGMSYDYFVSGNYTVSFDLINEFVGKIHELGDPNETVISFYNIVKILFFGKDFSLCLVLANKLIRLMRVYGIEDFQYGSIYDVIGIKAIIDCFEKKHIQAKIGLLNLKNVKRTPTDFFSPLLGFLEALICLSDNEKEKACKIIDRTLFEYLKSSFLLYQTAAFIAYEFAGQLYLSGDSDLAESYKKKGDGFALEGKLTEVFDKYSPLTLSEIPGARFNFSPLNINYSYLEQVAEKEFLLSRIHKKVTASRFLSRINSLYMKTVDKGTLVGNFCKLFADYVDAYSVYVVEKEIEGHIRYLGVNTVFDGVLPGGEKWKVLFDKYGIGSELQLREVEKNTYFVNISKADFSGGILFSISDKKRWTMDEIIIIETAIGYLQDQITIIKQNKHLEKISTTDILTKLNNRRSLETKIEEQNEFMRRYSDKPETSSIYSITFIDLDNFKFYNDNYGHQTGDILIACFGKLLRKTYRKVDFISRFGGDEFVIILPNTNLQSAVRAGNRLRKALEDARFFIPELERFLGRSPEVSTENLLGFSGGICCNLDMPDSGDVAGVLAASDKALRYAKKTGKNRVCCYNDVPAEER